LLSLPTLQNRSVAFQQGLAKNALDYILSGLAEHEDRWILLLAAVFFHQLGKLSGEKAFEKQTVSWYDEWQLSQRVIETAQQLGVEHIHARRLPITLRLILNIQHWFEEAGDLPVRRILENWLADPDVQRTLGVNRYNDVLWYNKEAFEDFVWWTVAVSLLQSSAEPGWSSAHLVERLLGSFEIASMLLDASSRCGYTVSGLLKALQEDEALNLT